MSKSSDEQASLDQFRTARELVEEEDVDLTKKPNWEPMADDESETGAYIICQNCGERVSQQFGRVYGDDDDRIHACPDCATYREMQEGLAAQGDGK